MNEQSSTPQSVFARDAPQLLEGHYRHLREGSGIISEVILERGYRSALGKAELEKIGFTKAQRRTPGILIPLWDADGQEAGYQYRPDSPRIDSKGRPVKYESPGGSSNRIDCPPRCKSALGDPNAALWITEGSKKADALASHGACAISLPGVWGFKGKNNSGGVTILSDWDYIALRGRTVYLAFDSDIVAKEPVRKALERLSGHLKHKKAKVLIVCLPQEGDRKTGIDDYLLTHSLEDAQRLVAEPDSEESHSNERSVSGFVLSDGTVGEMVVNEGERAFMLVANGSVRKATYYEAGGVTYIPTADPLVGQVVHFAGTATPYDSQTALFREIKAFIHRYLELPADFEDITALYVMLSWVYEFAPSVPYLRVIGDWGSGKTRFLQVVGSVCFRPIFASGATTPSPVFRILEKFQGTLVFDEADFKDSAAWVEMVKLLNNGYRPGMPVLRAEKENGKWYPRSFQVFGPKLIATRYSFKDEALESRCLTAEMMPLTRDDIPRVLPRSFSDEVNTLRSKLLTFRLANLFRLKDKTFGNELLDPDLQPRLQEILIPLKAMLNGDQSMAETLAEFVRCLQEKLFSRRRDSQAGKVLAAMMELHQEGLEISAQNIADRIAQWEDDSEITSRKVGWVVKKLGFVKERVGKSRQRLIQWDEDRALKLSLTYGLAASQGKLSEMSALSALATETADNIEEGVKTCPPECPPLFEAGATREADGADGADDIYRDTDETQDSSKPPMDIDDDPVEESLGMSRERAMEIWTVEGKPVVHLGPGENCFDLEKLLSHRYANPRHLDAVREWLRSKGGFDQDGEADSV